MPCIAPYSSTTIAMCWFVCRNSASSAAEVLRLRDEVRGAEELLDDDVLDPLLVEGREEVANVEDADDLVE